MAYVDFAHVRRLVPIESVVDWLGLEMKKAGDQLRGRCPINDGGERALVVTPAKGLWYCFAPECKSGGDCIELVAKVRQIGTRDAALALQKHFLPAGNKPAPADQPLKPLDYLQSKHELVQALGFPEHIAWALGIGYAPKGIMRGRVAIPIRDATGSIVAYAGVNPKLDPPVKLPSSFRMI